MKTIVTNHIGIQNALFSSFPSDSDPQTTVTQGLGLSICIYSSSMY